MPGPEATPHQQEPSGISPLNGIGAVDGRYYDRVGEVREYTPEFALIKTRVEVETKYLVALSDIGVVRPLGVTERDRLMSFGGDLSLQDAEKVKKIEKKTRHDVKAIERALREMLEGSSLEDVVDMLHIGLTSEDINNISYRLMLKRATEGVTPHLDGIVGTWTDWAEKYKATPMPARTHGQNAIPTTIGKEMAVFATRLNDQVVQLKDRPLTGKFSGAVGTFAAHAVAYPEIDWVEFSRGFIESFGLVPNMITTQINSYEDMVEYFQNYQRINGVIMDFDQDFWRYISDHWIAQTAVQGEVGSSTMPQKVNPIDFENSEGNAGLANAIFGFFSGKLQASRLQRDLTDSTVIRNLGLPIAYSLVSYKSLIEGMKRVSPDMGTIGAALDQDWSVLAEGAQTILRAAGISDPYTMVSERTRGEKIGQEEWLAMADDLPVPDELKDRIRALTPQTYLGEAVRLTEEAIKRIRSSNPSN